MGRRKKENPEKNDKIPANRQSGRVKKNKTLIIRSESESSIEEVQTQPQENEANTNQVQPIAAEGQKKASSYFYYVSKEKLSITYRCSICSRVS